MTLYSLPRTPGHVGVPPLKIQGIKTKLVPFIMENIEWDGAGRWIEPFMGSGVVIFNVAPDRALISDTNVHTIRFYQALQAREIVVEDIEDFLIAEGEKLQRGGVEYFKEVRQRFNTHHEPLDFLFLNRSCFNGLIRFSNKGNFNTPFGHKPMRFSRSYVTKICNQTRWFVRQMADKDWEFRVTDWREALRTAQKEDFVYLDPPYVGRFADYFNSWSQAEAEELAFESQNLPCGFALSMWLENRYRRNEHIEDSWPGNELRTMSHFYHLGSTESLRNEMQEALVIKPGYAAEHAQTLEPSFVGEEMELFG